MTGTVFESITRRSASVSMFSNRALPCTGSVTMPACQPVNERAFTPRTCSAIANSEADTCSPVESSASISRGSRSPLIVCVPLLKKAALTTLEVFVIPQQDDADVVRNTLRGVAWPEPKRAHAVGDSGAMWLWREETRLWERDPGAPIGF